MKKTLLNLAFTFIGRRPAKKGSQPLPRIELEDPIVLFWTDIKAAKARQGHTFASFETVIERFKKAIDLGRCCRFIGVHPCSKSTNEICFLDTICHPLFPSL